jgi:hypothetical protein
MAEVSLEAEAADEIMIVKQLLYSYSKLATNQELSFMHSEDCYTLEIIRIETVRKRVAKTVGIKLIH